MEKPHRSTASVIEHVFTHVNPTTGSEPPKHMAWVIFEHGTTFYTTPTEKLPVDSSLDVLVEAAKQSLMELGAIQPGSSSGDFKTAHLKGWFPSEFVYFVTYDHPAVISVVISEEKDDLNAGLDGRARRATDHDSMNISVARDFNGTERTEF